MERKSELFLKRNDPPEQQNLDKTGGRQRLWRRSYSHTFIVLSVSILGLPLNKKKVHLNPGSAEQTEVVAGRRSRLLRRLTLADFRAKGTNAQVDGPSAVLPADGGVPSCAG